MHRYGIRDPGQFEDKKLLGSFTDFFITLLSQQAITPFG
jgi:hypothetical protein